MWSRYSADSYADDEAKPKKKPTKTALVSAVDLLARQEHSERKLTDKLKRKGYNDEEIAPAIARLKEKHYLDDEAACQRQFAYLYQESHSSVKQICVKLMQRGFNQQLVRDCVPNDIYEREYAAALRTLELKYKPSADKQKLMASLYRKGFMSEAIRAAVAEFLQDK